MAQLYLHVGHGKTGTSFVQSIFALSQKALAKTGIIYPANDSFEFARQGKVTSGNGNFIYDIKNFDFKWGDKVLLSNELLFHDILDGRLNDILDFLGGGGFEKVNIMLFIRDVVDHAESSYQQVVKRGGSVASVEEFFSSYRQPELVLEFIERCSKYSNFELTIRNYSSCKDSLIDTFAQWLGVKKGIFEVPPVQLVNRSMTKSELRFQKSVNEVLGESGYLVSDQLCNRLPELRSEKCLPSLEFQEAMLFRLSPAINEVNKIVDPGHEYQEVVYKGAPSESIHESYELLGSQIDILAHSLASEILRLRLSKLSSTSMGDNFSDIQPEADVFDRISDKFGMPAADLLRDLALCFEKDKENYISALLMGIAHKARPKGPFIKKKLNEYLKDIQDR